MTLYPKIKVGAAEVYVTGTVVCRPGQTVEITPRPAPTGAYRVQLSFVDTEGARSEVAVTNLPDNVVLLTITNFGSGFNSTIAPVNIGNLAGNQLSIDIAGYSTGSGDTLVRVITFTVLQGAA